MTTTPRVYVVPFLIGLIGAGIVLATPGAAQFRPGGPPPTSARWNPSVGARTGWITRDADGSLGALLRVPVPVPLVAPALMASGGLIFRAGLTERQSLVELTFDLTRIAYVGAGAAALNSVFEVGTEPETKLGYSIVGGIRGGVSGPVGILLELRWVRVDNQKPSFIMFALTYGLRGPG